MDLFTLIKDEGWKVQKHGNLYKVATQYEEVGPIEIKHPVLIHLELFRRLPDPAKKYDHLKIAHDMLWPDTVWHEWTERRYRTFCEPWNYVTLAAGASASKSYDVAKYAIEFWYAAPKERNVTIASVTLASLLTRVWGYLTAHIKSMAVPLPYKYLRSGSPKILLEEPSVGKNKIEDDTLHGIFAVTAQQGDDDQAVATWIGKHPKDKILIILDECTDMPMSIFNSTPNLNSHPDKFQLVGIGNSLSTMDLHGVLCTPLNGWASVSIELQQWPTVQPNGTCLYFNPYESPAITHPDPEMRKVLAKFLMGAENLAAKEKELGKDSEKFFRWVLGFWKSRNLEDVVVTEAFLKDKDFYSEAKVEWSGFYPLIRVASLDPSFSVGGDKCILRIATVGHSIDNKIKIDFNNGMTMHEIKLSATSGIPLEKQVGLESIAILRRYGVKLEHFAVDVSGPGRAIAQVIVLLNELQNFVLGRGNPLKINSMSHHNMHKRKKSAPDVLPFNAYNLWMELRDYMAQNHVLGIDETTKFQLNNRRIIYTEIKGKQTARLESKLEYKKRMSAIGNAHSPDEADAAALIIQVVKKVLMIEPGAIWSPPRRTMDPRTDAKMSAWLGGPASGGLVTGGSAPMVLEADFSGTLESYAHHLMTLPIASN